MKICILDGHTLNPGDLSWESLRELGDCVVHERTPPGEVAARAAGAGVVLTNKAVLGREQIAALPGLRFIGVTATGFNVVDIDAARERGIVVSNVPGYGTRSVAQHVFALILELTQRVGDHSRAARGDGWPSSKDWCFWDGPLVELDGLTLGVVGLGEIGSAVAGIGQAFGMRVLATRSSRRPMPANAVEAGIDEIVTRSDVVTLHCPLTPETRGLVDAARLAAMKPSALLINTARGPLVDEAALAAALDAGRIAGAGLDVLSQEPPAAGNPLLTARNCVITPHMAWASRAARAR
ncbi:MAG: D-2-hydroxyacid dehydrogenase, partial [Verrucomicrobiota bacterium]